MKRYALTLLLVLIGSALMAQQNIIFETDMGNDVDDALAIDMLYKYHRQKRIDLKAVMLNKEGEYPVRFIDLLNKWYGCPHIPIGTCSRTRQSRVAGQNYTQVVVEEKDAKGKPLYKRSLKRYDRLPTSVELYRKLLAKAKDGSITIVSVGFSNNLAELLTSDPDRYSPLSGKELVRRKVARLVAMVGHFTNPNYAEYNVTNDIPACQKVFREWPTPIYCSGFEVGERILYPKRSILEDFGWTQHHPIVDAYKNYLPKLEDRPTWDLTAVLFAIDPGNRFGVSEPGEVVINDKGQSHYTATPDGKHFFLTVTDKQRKDIQAYFVDMITKRP